MRELQRMAARNEQATFASRYFSADTRQRDQAGQSERSCAVVQQRFEDINTFIDEYGHVPGIKGDVDFAEQRCKPESLANNSAFMTSSDRSTGIACYRPPIGRKLRRTRHKPLIGSGNAS